MALRLLLKFVPVIPGPVPAWQQLASREGTGTFYTHYTTPHSARHLLPMLLLPAPSMDGSCISHGTIRHLFLCKGLISFISIASKFIHIGLGVGLSGLCFRLSLVDTGLSVLSNMPTTTLHRELSSRKTIVLE